MSMSFDSRDYARFDELAEEFAERCRRGERPSLQEYVDRLPEMAREIHEMFPALVEVEKAKGDAHQEPRKPPPPAAAGLSHLGDYRIIREIGRGGMGVVFEAEQVSLGRQVALKVLPSQVMSDRKTRERFRREAKAAARLHHTNIVPVFEVGSDRDVSFYAMQLIRGQGLEQVIDELLRLRDPGRKPNAPGSPGLEGPVPPETISQAPIADASKHAGRELVRMTERLLTGRLIADSPDATAGDRLATDDAGATGRVDPGAIGADEVGPGGPQPGRSPPPHATDLSGSAVLPGGTHVSDVDTSGRRQPFFRSVAQIGRQAAQGLAYAHARGIVHRDIKPSNLLLDTSGVVWITDFGLAKAEEDGLTQTGDILGTLRYMAPERFRGEGDAHADIYGLGITLYELSTLRPAFDTNDRLKLIERVKNEEPTRPRSIDDRIPRDLETIILKAIDKDPARRYASADAMAEDLRRFLADEPIRARQVGVAERYWRWARRNPTIATMGSLLALLMLAITIGSLWAANYYYGTAYREANLAAGERSAKEQSQRDREDALQARREAIEERDRSWQLSSGLALEKGIALGEEGRADQGLHWMLEALRTAPEEATALRRAIRWNLGAWIGQVHRPLRIGESIGESTHIGFSPDGRRFATGFDPYDRDRATPIDLWDTASGAKIRTLPPAVAPFVFRSDGLVMFATAEPRKALAVEIATGRVLWTSEPLAGEMPIDIYPGDDGSTVYVHRSGGSPRTDWLSRLDAATGRPLGQPLELPGLSCVSPDGRAAVVARGEDGAPRITLHELPSGRRIGSWTSGASNEEVTRGPWRVQFSPDGGSLYLTNRRGGAYYLNESYVARTWDAGLGRELSPLMPRSTYITYAAAGDRMLTLTNNLWLMRRSPDGQPRGSGFSINAGFGHGAKTHPDGLTVVNIGGEHTIRLWQISPEAESIAAARTGGDMATAGSRPGRLLPSVSVLYDGFLTDGRIAITDASDASGRDRVLVSDIATGLALGRPAPHQVGWVVRALALSPDGRSFATGSNPDGRTAGEVCLWDVATGLPRFPPRLHTNYVAALAFSPDGKVLAAGDFHNLVRRYDTSTGREIGRPMRQTDIVQALAYSPDGKVLAVGLANDRSGKPGVRLWDAEAGRRIGELLPGIESVQRVEFRRDGRVLLAAHPNYLQLWDAVERRAIGGPMLEETSGGFRPDGRAFLTLGRDGVVKLRDASTGAVLSRLMAAPSPALCAAFKGDGSLVAAGFGDGSVRLCDPATSQTIGPPRFMEYAISKVAFTPDGLRVAGIDAEGNSRLWPVPRPLPDEGPDDLRLRIEARTGLHMEHDRTIAGLDTAAWRERLERLGRLDPSALRIEVAPAWHEPMAREAEQEGNAFAATWHLDRLIAEHPDDWSLFARRARARGMADRFEEAAADYERAESLGPRDRVLDFQGRRVVECAGLGRPAEALWYLDRLIAARPDEVMLREERAAVLGKLGREADRHAELARVFEQGTDEGPTLIHAEQLAREGRWAQAARLLTRCGRAHPLSPTLAQAWAIACLRAGDRAGFREACEADLAFARSFPAFGWELVHAAWLFALGADGLDDYDVPISWIERRLSATPAPSPPMRHYLANALGGLLLRAGRFDEAIARLEEGIASPSQVELATDWAFLALAHARKGDIVGARRWLDRLHGIADAPGDRFWDSQELSLLRSEAEALVLDAGFPAEPFQGRRSD